MMSFFVTQIISGLTYRKKIKILLGKMYFRHVKIQTYFKLLKKLNFKNDYIFVFKFW